MMRLHIEITDEQAKELLAEAMDGMAPPLQDYMQKNSTLCRLLIRNAIMQRMPK